MYAYFPNIHKLFCSGQKVYVKIKFTVDKLIIKLNMKAMLYITFEIIIFKALKMRKIQLSCCLAFILEHAMDHDEINFI